MKAAFVVAATGFVIAVWQMHEMQTVLDAHWQFGAVALVASILASFRGLVLAGRV